MAEIKVNHPDYGHVMFTNPTPRQIEVLNHYNKLLGMNKIEREEWHKHN